MTTNRTAHTNCDHEATPAARAKCRKLRKAAAQAHLDAQAAVIDALGQEWLFKAASRFGKVRTSDSLEAADAVIAYFFPSGDEDKDARRRANGYTVTTSAYEIRRIVLRSFS